MSIIVSSAFLFHTCSAGIFTPQNPFMKRSINDGLHAVTLMFRYKS